MRLHAGALVVLMLVGCAGNDVPPANRCLGVRCIGTSLCDPATGLCRGGDASTDAASDAAVDSGSDASVPNADAGLDAGFDGGHDSGTFDGGTDAGSDAGLDAGLVYDAGCRSDAVCFGATQKCRVETGACVECLRDGDCFASVAPRCDPVRFTCLMCLSNLDCADVTAPVCGALSQCVGCTTSAECGAGRECDVVGQCHALPDACGAERVLSLPGDLGSTSFSADPSLALDDAAGSCSPLGGPELVYRVTTSQVRDLFVTVAPLGVTTGARPTVFLRSGSCATGTELGCDSPATGGASVSVPSLPAGDTFIFVELAPGSSGRVLVTVRLAATTTGPANDSCAAPSVLTFSGATASAVGSTTGASNDDTATCSASTSTGTDLVYQYTLAAPSNVTATVRALTGSALHPVISVRAACAAGALERGCLASVLGQAVSLTLPAQAAGSSFVWVDSADGTNGAFALDVTATPLVGNDTCATAQVLSFVNGVATATGDTTGATNGNLVTDATPGCSNSARSTGRDVVFSYTLTQPADVTLSVTPTGAAPTFEPVLVVRAACTDASATAELACVSPALVAPASTTLLAQSAGTWFVWVDGAQDTFGPFQLEARSASPTPPPANDSCSGAIAIDLSSGHALVSGSTALAANDGSTFDVLPTCSALAKQNGRDVVYSFTLAQPQNVTLTVTSAGALHPVLSVRRACASQLLSDEVVCLERTSVATTTLERLDPGTYFVWVDSTASTSGAFTLEATVSLPTPAPLNDGCAQPTALHFVSDVAVANGTLVGATNSNVPSDNAPSCGDAFFPKRFGKDVVFSYQLLTPHDIDVAITPAPGSAWVPVAYVRQPGQCTNGGAGGEAQCIGLRQPGPLKLSLPNQAAGTWSLFVDSNSYDEGDFQVTVTQRAPTSPPSNNSCASPLPVGATPIAGDTTAATNDFDSTSYSAACGRYFFDGRDVVYQYTATATGTVTATLTPQGAFDGALLLLTPTCGAAHCVRFSDSAGAGGAEALSFAATQGTTWFLVVDSYDRTQPNTWGAFTLTVQ